MKEWVNRATKLTKGDILSQKEADLNDGFSPLHYASYHGNAKLIDMLIEAGADIYVENE